jgi:hypothetical protein
MPYCQSGLHPWTANTLYTGLALLVLLLLLPSLFILVLPAVLMLQVTSQWWLTSWLAGVASAA